MGGATAHPPNLVAHQLQQLRQQVNQLTRQLEAVNKRLAAMTPGKPAAPAMAGTAPKTIKAPAMAHAKMPAITPAKKQPAAPAPAKPSAAARAAARRKAKAKRLRRKMRRIEKEINQANQIGLGATETGTRMIIAGDGYMGYNFIRGPGHPPASFNAGITPLILWQLDHNFLAVGSFSLNYGPGSVTNLSAGQAYLAYHIGHNIILGAGVFTIPFGQYHNHFDPSWINPLPDDPLFSGTTLDPGNGLGVFANGAIPIGPSGHSEFTYNLYAVNGPTLQTTNGGAGQLAFNNFTDNNNDKAVGGRIAWLPMPELELGYSAQYGKVSPDGYANNVDAFLQAVDLNYYFQSPKILGLFRARAEWYFQHVSQATYGVPGGGFGPLSFASASNGGYAQLSYQPIFAGNPIIKNFEAVGRWDYLDLTFPTSQGGGGQQRWTVGLDYWLNWRTVLKGAYEWDERNHAPSNSAFLLQLGFEF